MPLDDRLRDKLVLLLPIFFLMGATVLVLGQIVAGGNDGSSPSFFRMLTAVLLAMLGGCVYRFVRM